MRNNKITLDSQFTFKDRYDSINEKKLNKEVDKNRTNSSLKVKVFSADNPTQDGFKDFFKSYTSYVNSNERLTHVLRDKELIELSKDEEINQLNNMIDEYTTKNKEMRLQMHSEIKGKEEVEVDQRDIADYCNDLKRKFYNVDQTVEEYEKAIHSLQSETDLLVVNYENKINNLLDKNLHLKENMEYRKDIIEEQKNEIRELEISIDVILRDTEEQRIINQEKETLTRIKYEEMDRKYVALQKKVYEFQMNNEIRRTEIQSKNIGMKPEEKLEMYQ